MITQLWFIDLKFLWNAQHAFLATSHGFWVITMLWVVSKVKARWCIYLYLVITWQHHMWCKCFPFANFLCSSSQVFMWMDLSKLGWSLTTSITIIWGVFVDMNLLSIASRYATTVNASGFRSVILVRFLRGDGRVIKAWVDLGWMVSGVCWW